MRQRSRLGLRSLADRYLDLAVRFPGRLLLAFLVVTVLAAAFASRLGLKTDFVELLPDHLQSVKSLHELIDRTGGNGMLLVVVEGEEFSETRAFMERAAEALKLELSDDIHSLEYKATEIRSFFEKNALLYLPLDELHQLDRSLENEIRRAKLKANPLWFDLEEDEAEGDDREAIDDALKENTGGPIKTVEGYYGIDQGRMLLLIIHPKGSHMSVTSSKELVGRVQATLADLHAAYGNAGVTYGLCGNVQSSVDEYDTVKRDIFSTATLCILLVALVLLVYFRNLWIVLSLTSVLLIALAWTFGFISLIYSHLNTQSAFLAALVIGTGINYGIIILSRLAFESQRGLPMSEAIPKAVRASMAATFLASITTAVSFLALALALNRGFHQFGWMGAIGVLCCWISSFFVLPLLIAWLHQRGIRIRFRPFPFNLWGPVGLFSWRRAPMMLGVAGVMFAAAVVIGLPYLKEVKEVDLTKLRNQTSLESGTEALESRAGHIFRRSLTPAAVLTDSLEESRQVCSALAKQSAKREYSMVDSCSDVENMLPEGQGQKLAILGKIRKRLNDPSVKWAEGEDKERIDELRSKASVDALSLADLPEGLLRPFEELDGTLGRMVFVYPKGIDLLSKEPTLKAFAEEVGTVELQSGKVLHAAGEPMILADLLGFLDSDGPKITFWSVLGVLIAVLVASRSFAASVGIMGSLLLGFVWMWAWMATLGLKLNFFNFVAIPLMFGICVDYAANLYLRLGQAKAGDEKDFARIYAHGAGSVTLCSLTTIIGYSALLSAHNRAVASFGELALLGEFSAILAAILFVPVFHRLFTRNRASQK